MASSDNGDYAYHKYRVNRNSWPKVRDMVMNPTENPESGDHQDVSKAFTVKRGASSSKNWLIAARRTGRIREGKKDTDRE